MDTAELKTLLTNAHATTPSGKIVRVLSQRGALSGARIAGITGLAKSTVSTTLAELRKSGIIVDDAGSKSDAPASVGRPGNTVTLNPLAGTCVGVLLGVQHIQVVIADVSHAVLAEKLFYIDPDYSPARAAEVIKALIAEACDELGISQRTILGVGMALAAPVNPLDGRILRAGGIPTWTGVDIRAEFEPVLGARVFADNESNCSAIAEMMWGAAVGHEDFVFVTLDIGVGGAIVHRGHLLTGIAGAAGEFGHMSINPDGALCRCGNRGCLELYASFRQALVFAEQRFGRPMTTEDVIGLAFDGDEGCKRLLLDCAEAAGRGLGIVGSVLNPGFFVIGGALARAGDLFLTPLEASYNKHTLVKRTDVGNASQTKFVTSKFADNGACLGAVGVVLQHHARLA